MLAAAVALAASSVPPSSPPSVAPVCSDLETTFSTAPFTGSAPDWLKAALGSSPSQFEAQPQFYCVFFEGRGREPVILGLKCRATSGDTQTLADLFTTNCVNHPRAPPSPALVFTERPSPPLPPAPPSPPQLPTPLSLPHSESEGLTAPVIAGIAVGAALGTLAMIVMSVLAVKHVRKGGDAAVVREYRDKSNEVEITQVQKPA